MGLPIEASVMGQEPVTARRLEGPPDLHHSLLLGSREASKGEAISPLVVHRFFCAVIGAVAGFGRLTVCKRAVILDLRGGAAW